jgi:hypothetical protein
VGQGRHQGYAAKELLAMSDPVAAITEANATGEIAEIFADIRRVLRVGAVNLIWRHLATIPGVLPWAWESLRPLYVDGTIGAEAAALRGDLDFARLPPFPREVLAAAGLLDDDIRTIRNILAAYDRTNAMALVALSALLLRLEDKPLRLAPSSRDASAVREPLPLIPLPPLLNLADMPPATAELVLTLNRLGTRRDNPILASMYRFLVEDAARKSCSAWTSTMLSFRGRSNASRSTRTPMRYPTRRS